MEALAGLAHLCRQPFESDRRVHEVAQHRLAGRGVSGEVGVERLREQRIAESWILPPGRRAGAIVFSRERAGVRFR